MTVDDSRISDEVLLRFDANDGQMALIIEDDNRVAYAYLLQRASSVALLAR
jgi:hypothetical protein